MSLTAEYSDVRAAVLCESDMITFDSIAAYSVVRAAVLCASAVITVCSSVAIIYVFIAMAIIMVPGCNHPGLWMLETID